jgi:hypothetical protein
VNNINFKRTNFKHLTRVTRFNLNGIFSAELAFPGLLLFDAKPLRSPFTALKFVSSVVLVPTGIWVDVD